MRLRERPRCANDLWFPPRARSGRRRRPEAPKLFASSRALAHAYSDEGRVTHDFAQLVAEHQAMVYSCAWHCLRDASLAEEVAQEVFLELHRKLGQLESAAHVRHWLRKAAAHRAIDEARRRRLRPRLSLDKAEEPFAPAPESDPMMSGTLRRLVASLPETARMVVILRYQEDLDPVEIAGVLEMPVRTVKSHLQRSLALLRGKLTRCAGGIRT